MAIAFQHECLLLFSSPAMSRAFVKEDAAEEQPLPRVRAPLPEGATNYVTPRGLELLQREKRDLEEHIAHEQNPGRQSVLLQELAELTYRLMTARVIDLRAHAPAQVRFGATVRVSTEGDQGKQEMEFTLVGVDEADASGDLVSFFSPLGQALVGKGIGETASVTNEDGGEVEATILAISYE
jgi:transcription elongation factor GreB